VTLNLFAQEVAYQGFGLARCRAVANRDRLDVVLRDQRHQDAMRARHVKLWGMRIDHVLGKKLSSVVHHGDLAAGTDAGIEAEHGELSRRRGE
jgi:hypothetical protein